MVLLVLITIHSITAVGVIYIYPDLLEEPCSYNCSAHCSLGFVLWLNTTLNYLATVLRDPGFVTETKKETGALSTRVWEGYRFCSRCQQAKPPRSHHCRICRRCVHHMDHHCPFVGNCVGRNNRRSFVLFLFWAASSLAYVLVITVMLCLDRSTDIAMNIREATERLPPLSQKSLPRYLHSVLTHNYVGIHLHAVGFLLLVGSTTFIMTFSLFLQQAWLICHGKTTISRLQERRRARQKLPQLSIQTRRLQENVQEVLGTEPWMWCLPSCPLPTLPKLPSSHQWNQPAKKV